MRIKLTADTRVLLSAGTVVDVSKETAAVIQRLGRCVLLDEEAVKKADTAEEEPEAKAEAKPKAKPKAKPRAAAKKKD